MRFFSLCTFRIGYMYINCTTILKKHIFYLQYLGGTPSRVEAAKAVVDAGIAVMGHVGLTPQAISSLGGFRPQVVIRFLL